MLMRLRMAGAALAAVTLTAVTLAGCGSPGTAAVAGPDHHVTVASDPRRRRGRARATSTSGQTPEGPVTGR